MTRTEVVRATGLTRSVVKEGLDYMVEHRYIGCREMATERRQPLRFWCHSKHWLHTVEAG